MLHTDVLLSPPGKAPIDSGRKTLVNLFPEKQKTETKPTPAVWMAPDGRLAWVDREWGRR